MAANLAGGILAVEANIIDFEMRRIFQTVGPEIKTLRETTIAPVSDNFALIGEFINEHAQNILSIDAAADARSGKPKRPYVEPRGALYIRDEPDTQIVYIASGRLRKFLGDRQVNMDSTIKDLTDRGCVIKTHNKNMGKGMAMTTSPTRCVWFDSSHPDFIGTNAIAKEADDVSGESELPD